jgi:hypothetical protein
MTIHTEGGDNLVTESGISIGRERESCQWPTLVEVKADLGITVPDDDAFLQRNLNASIAAIENYLGRKVPLQVDAEYFRLTDCDKRIGYQCSLQLARFPVLELISCVDTTGTEVSASIDEHGMLCGDFGAVDGVHVDYHGGYSCDSIDYDAIVDVFWQMISYRWSQKNATGGGAAAGDVKKESIPGVMAVEYFSGTEGSTSSSSNPADAKAYDYVLDKYKSYYV